ncbi:hypothetical protein [Veillonella caviae]|uniref:hypothetical protein n=1 Tax=Veillonella caviae TaxID=248316 RepID=UPI0023F4D705|nr:hypothetical protein [Veillonella caviae]MCI6407821.1 hypothetical protein [Veillonella caviae]MDY6224647.1 hypothetical protein [Veillonella caviae]
MGRYRKVVMMVQIQERMKKQLKLELARREFFYYCNQKAGDFYKKDRSYLVNLCNELQQFIDSDEYNVLIMNLPP